MEERKWEELDKDCLVNVIRRVGVESLLLSVPFVCKTWYEATLSPLCWRRLAFPQMLPDDGNGTYSGFTSRLVNSYQVKGYFPFTRFIMSIVKRSNRSATFLALPVCCTKEALLYVADECPKLRALLLPYEFDLNYYSMIPGLLSKWTRLEFLVLGDCLNMEEILAQVNILCKHLVGFGIISAYFEENEASAIVTFLPNIKYLSLNHAFMKRADLVTILKGCKELVYFDARQCQGFEAGDGKILKLASHIRVFRDEGSMRDEHLWAEHLCDGCFSFPIDGFLDGYCSD
ncbi:hypothetical protein RHGRI_026089 [Rhododendron griersonianum]|uniref:F-box domain-containing protein n=1 Tax=Rhododendron griersonianum TaxID=479676 RepID=A0AAV6IV36_9ERIC|nr:hypothetical protein RHGRI_026089 [Rhododendron griersonianum]